MELKVCSWAFFSIFSTLPGPRETSCVHYLSPNGKTFKSMDEMLSYNRELETEKLMKEQKKVKNVKKVEKKVKKVKRVTQVEKKVKKVEKKVKRVEKKGGWNITIDSNKRARGYEGEKMSGEEGDREHKRSRTSEETEGGWMKIGWMNEMDGWMKIHRLVEEQSAKDEACKLEVEELKKQAQEKDDLIASKDVEIQRLLEKQCANNEAYKTKVEELKKNARENEHHHDELIKSIKSIKDETISILLKEQYTKSEASKVEIESLKKKNEEMLELLASINKQISSNAKKLEPKDPLNEKPREKRVKVFHYTTTMGLEGITKEGVVRKSADGFSGEGVYLTSLNPDHFTREQVAQNIYGSPTWQERLAAGNLDCWLEVQVEESRLSRCTLSREVFILLEDLQLEEGRWRAGQTPQTAQTPQTSQTPEIEYIQLKVMDDNKILNEIHFRVKQTTQMAKLKKSYSERSGVPLTSLIFLFKGHKIDDDATPKELKMEQDDIISVQESG